jgi:hypothetical protein
MMATRTNRSVHPSSWRPKGYQQIVTTLSHGCHTPVAAQAHNRNPRESLSMWLLMLMPCLMVACWLVAIHLEIGLSQY